MLALSTRKEQRVASALCYMVVAWADHFFGAQTTTVWSTFLFALMQTLASCTDYEYTSHLLAIGYAYLVQVPNTLPLLVPLLTLFFISDATVFCTIGIVNVAVAAQQTWPAMLVFCACTFLFQVHVTRQRKWEKYSLEALVIHRNGRIIDVNDTFCSMFKYDLEQAQLLDITSVFVAPLQNFVTQQEAHKINFEVCKSYL